MKITGVHSPQEVQTTRKDDRPVLSSFEDTLNEQISLSGVNSTPYMAPSLETTQMPVRVVSSQAATVLDQREISFFENMLNPMTSRYSKESMYNAQASTPSTMRLNRIA